MQNDQNLEITDSPEQPLPEVTQAQKRGAIPDYLRPDVLRTLPRVWPTPRHCKEGEVMERLLKIRDYNTYQDHQGQPWHKSTLRDVQQWMARAGHDFKLARHAFPVASACD